MFDYNRGAKAGGIAGIIIGAIGAILSFAIVILFKDSFPEISRINIDTTGYMVAFMVFCWDRIIWGIVSGGIFGIIYAAVYNKLPGSSSLKKGIVFAIIYWIIIGIIVCFLLTSSQENMYEFYVQSVGLGLVTSLIWGALTGKLWDRYGGGEKQPLI